MGKHNEDESDQRGAAAANEGEPQQVRDAYDDKLREQNWIKTDKKIDRSATLRRDGE